MDTGKFEQCPSAPVERHLSDINTYPVSLNHLRRVLTVWQVWRADLTQTNGLGFEDVLKRMLNTAAKFQEIKNLCLKRQRLESEADGT